MSIIIYGATLSPFVRKVHVVAAEKGIEITPKITNPAQPDADFLACSPFRKIPALRDGDFQVCDSSAIVHYFEAIKPEPAMIPAEAKARARTVWIEEFVDTILVPAAGPMFFHRIVGPRFLGMQPDEEAIRKSEQESTPPALDYLEGLVPDAGGFLVGDSLTLADISVASVLANLRHLDFDMSRWPRTKAYGDAILERPSFTRVVETENRILGR